MIKRSVLLIVVVALGSVTAFHSSASWKLPVRQSAMEVSGAYRDGLYLGRLAAQHGSNRHVPTGRWSTVADRTAFHRGYEEGYNTVVSRAVEPER